MFTVVASNDSRDIDHISRRFFAEASMRTYENHLARFKHRIATILFRIVGDSSSFFLLDGKSLKAVGVTFSVVLFAEGESSLTS